MKINQTLLDKLIDNSKEIKLSKQRMGENLSKLDVSKIDKSFTNFEEALSTIDNGKKLFSEFKKHVNIQDQLSNELGSSELFELYFDLADSIINENYNLSEKITQKINNYEE